jgi:hypothetical protein
VDHQEVCPVEDLDPGGDKRGEGRHAGNPIGARRVKASVPIARHVARKAEGVRDVHQTIFNTLVILQQLAVVLGGRAHH